jgi:hypothetical protein
MEKDVTITKHASGLDVITSKTKERKFCGVELSGIWIDEVMPIAETEKMGL